MKELLSVLEYHFEDNHRRAIELAAVVGDQKLFSRPAAMTNSSAPASPGEHIVRSAAVVEQAMGGITTRLWDDPFEWTLPEELSTVSRVVAYLEEVRDFRIKGFGFFLSDDDLRREMPAPEVQRSIFDILLGAIRRSSEHIGRASAIYLAVRAD